MPRTSWSLLYQLALEGAVEDGGQEGVEFGGDLHLVPIHQDDLILNNVQRGRNTLLFGQWR